MPSALPAPLDSRPENRPLFAYGTLLDRGFVRNLLEHEVVAEPATLLDWRVTSLEGASWPTVVPAAGARTDGVLYRGLEAEDRRRIDAYEGVLEGLYERLLLVVESDAGSESAWVYRMTGRALARYGGSGR